MIMGRRVTIFCHAVDDGDYNADVGHELIPRSIVPYIWGPGIVPWSRKMRTESQAAPSDGNDHQTYVYFNHTSNTIL